MKKFVICENIILEIIVRIAQNDTHSKWPSFEKVIISDEHTYTIIGNFFFFFYCIIIFFLGTFALTSLISANAVERLVPSAGTNFTANNNSGVLGLSEFEMQRIGVAAAVSFLGGIIQVNGEHTFCMLLMFGICDNSDFCNILFSLLQEKLIMGLV